MLNFELIIIQFGFEARAFLKRLAKLLAEEWEKPYPVVVGFINARMSIALVRATNALEVPGPLRTICLIAFVGKEVQDLDF